MLAQHENDKIVYFVRHAEATHNLPGDIGYIISKTESDTDLTAAGVQMAKDLSNDPILSIALSHNDRQRVQLILSSPLRRAMRTADLAFAGVHPHIPFALDPKLVEQATDLANTASPAKAAVTLRDMDNADLSRAYAQLPEGWVLPPHSEDDPSHVRSRFGNLTVELLLRPERRVIIVSHGLFMLTGFGLVPQNCGVVPLSLSAMGQWNELLPRECLRIFR